MMVASILKSKWFASATAEYFRLPEWAQNGKPSAELVTNLSHGGPYGADRAIPLSDAGQILTLQLLLRFFDAPDYLADGLFLKHRAQVHFAAAMAKLPNKMLLCRLTDYLDVCSKVWGTIQTELDGRRDLYGPERTAEQTQ